MLENWVLKWKLIPSIHYSIVSEANNPARGIYLRIPATRIPYDTAVKRRQGGKTKKQFAMSKIQHF
jgi:hypothetical protein